MVYRENFAYIHFFAKSSVLEPHTPTNRNINRAQGLTPSVLSDGWVHWCPPVPGGWLRSLVPPAPLPWSFWLEPSFRPKWKFRWREEKERYGTTSPCRLLRHPASSRAGTRPCWTNASRCARTWRFLRGRRSVWRSSPTRTWARLRMPKTRTRSMWTGSIGSKATC